MKLIKIHVKTGAGLWGDSKDNLLFLINNYLIHINYLFIILNSMDIVTVNIFIND